ncbi:MAG: putative selenate reductase subunit YgfK [Mogibacterium sp.]|nr:putative selenate reductase subunit YgfK [Mogibacterium sp.]
MSDIMTPMSFEHLMTWVLDEHKKEGSIFGEKRMPKLGGGRELTIFKEKLESPFGPAAGPNTQLAQNIIASYVTGARFFELKTVQIMDGRELAACVAKPCITAHDECYNCEWSTELEVGQAYEEYVKAWIICKVIARELGLGEPDGFVFNMSVGYDLEGIKSEKVDKYIEGMKDASDRPVFKNSIKWLKDNITLFKEIDMDFVDSIPAQVSASITESTLHGCPPDEIERIATYLIEEKGLNTYIKCNPTLLGYETARERLDSCGYDYIVFDDHHFVEDLQWADAVPMFNRLIKLCEEKGLEFGVKLTNTFPVDVAAGELPSEEMYMSGRSLYILTTELARRISKEFEGKLRISYSGGADAHNIKALFDAGIWPITMATTLLKPGGYERMAQIADELKDCSYGAFAGVDPAKVEKLAAESLTDSHYRKPIKPLPERKMARELPLIDCFGSPCSDGCPINQDIPEYLSAMSRGDDEEALKIILKKNALPFITGTICPHTCADKCMRNHYEESVHIREVKLEAATSAFDKLIGGLKAETASDKKVAVIGAGPAGLAIASFLSRAGVKVTVFEKTDKAGGVVRHIIPGFRISDESIDKDVALCSAYGAEFKFEAEVKNPAELLAEGYDDVVIAIGAWEKGRANLEYGEEMDALEFLFEAKNNPGSLNIGKNIVVIGGGNTAMDVARAAKKVEGVENVRLVYRRTKRYMPADEEELIMAVDDGVEFMELLAPIGVKDGVLECSVMKLGEPDESGRRSPVDTGEKTEVPADTVIAAVGERIDPSVYLACGAVLDEKGRPVLGTDLKTSVDHIYAAGDCKAGPATVVKGIADAARVAIAIAGVTFYDDSLKAATSYSEYKDRHAILAEPASGCDGERCLGCQTVCETCVEVCPNRANIAVDVEGLDMPQIVHVDIMCNECGNCAVFCPYSGRPYKDKLTVFAAEEDFADSENEGFLPLEGGKVRMRYDKAVFEFDPTSAEGNVPDDVRALILAVMSEYGYLLGI